MKIELRNVAKGPARARALEPTSTAFTTGTAVLVEAETEQRPTVLGLIASGRMKPDAGEVLLDGKADARTIRVRTALVDAPDVCDPAPDVTVYGLVEEELMFAGRPSNLIAARRWLDDNGFGGMGRMPISAVAPRERISLLLELTALRRRVTAMVLVSPDRHGGDPREWWRIVQDFAARGYAMLVIAGVASAMVLQERDAAAVQHSESTDTTPEESTGSTPEESTGSTPEASTGSTPEASTGSAPEASTDSTPEESTGSTPEESTEVMAETEGEEALEVQQARTATTQPDDPPKSPAETAGDTPADLQQPPTAATRHEEPTDEAAEPEAGAPTQDIPEPEEDEQ